MKERRYYVRALGMGLLTTLTALAVYDRPPEWSMYWQPALQGCIMALSSLGLNLATRKRE